MGTYVMGRRMTSTVMAHLNKPPEIDIAETNIALWGSDVSLTFRFNYWFGTELGFLINQIPQIHKRVREHAGDTERAWEGVGQEEGFWIWRIEDFKVVHWPDERKGQFYDGDSYIVLRVSKI